MWGRRGGTRCWGRGLHTRHWQRSEAGGERLAHRLELLLQRQRPSLLQRQFLLQTLARAAHALRVPLQHRVLLLEGHVHLPQAPQLRLPSCRRGAGSEPDASPPSPCRLPSAGFAPSCAPRQAFRHCSVSSPTPQQSGLRGQERKAPTASRLGAVPSWFKACFKNRWSALTFVLVQELFSEDGDVES